MQHRTYSAFGLRILSEIELPAPEAAPGPADLTILQEDDIAADFSPPMPAVREKSWRRYGAGWLLRYRNARGGVLEYEFSEDGRTVTARTSLPGLDHGAIALGPALGAALHLQGIPVLHGSAVVAGGRALLLAGAPGAGKSTLAATLAAMGLGCSFLTDDLAVLDVTERGVSVRPGLPWLKLEPDTGMALDRGAGDWPRAYGPGVADDKRRLDAAGLGGGFSPAAAPLGAVYLLGPRRAATDRCRIAPLTAPEACVALVPHFYGTDLLRIPAATRLSQASRIASLAACRHCWVPDGLSCVRAAAQAVLDDALSAG